MSDDFAALRDEIAKAPFYRLEALRVRALAAIEESGLQFASIEHDGEFHSIADM